MGDSWQTWCEGNWNRYYSSFAQCNKGSNGNGYQVGFFPPWTLAGVTTRGGDINKKTEQVINEVTPPSPPMTFELAKQAVNRLGASFASALRPLLPASVAIDGKTYRLSSVSTPEQMAWYFAAVAKTAPATASGVVNALKRQAGMPYDAADLPMAYDAESFGLDGQTILIILSVLMPALVIPNLLIAMLAGFGKPAAETDESKPPDSVGNSEETEEFFRDENGNPIGTEAEEEKLFGVPRKFVILGAALWMMKKNGGA